MKRAIEWFANNSVAANLLMLLVVVAGALAIPTIKKEVFPEISSDMVSVTLLYPGATPVEVEESICTRVEEAVQGISGIKRITSTAVENSGTVMIELVPGEELRTVLDEVKSAVDGITSFPEEAESPVVQEVKRTTQVVNVAISGQAEELALKRLGEQVRDEISNLPEITLVELTNVRPYEISIEVSEEVLRRYGMTFDEVARAVRLASLDLPGGTVKTRGGEVLVRTKGQAYRAPEFAALPVRTLPDGTRLRVGDLAKVVDGFADTDLEARFDGAPAVLVEVYRVGNQSALEVSDAVRDYVEEAQPRMPEGIKLTTWMDESVVLRGRLGLLLRNGRLGIMLVFLSLALFLRPGLAFWVTMGIPISFLGAMWLIPVVGLSINLISLFAFIVVLGIVVDDAIVVGENIYTHRARGKTPIQAAVDGTKEVSMPVVFAVLTTIAAFYPLLAVDGNMGKVMKQIPMVVILTLVFSLLESLFVLPAHLAHLRKRAPAGVRGQRMGAWYRFQDAFSSGMTRLVERSYRPSLRWALQRRYFSFSLGVAALLLAVGLVAGGHLRFTFFPPVEADNVVAVLTMPQGTSIERTSAAIRRIEEAARQVRQEIEEEAGQRIVAHTLATVGAQPYVALQSRHSPAAPAVPLASHVGEVNLQLVPAEKREVTAVRVASRWRELVGAIPDAVELTFTSDLFSSGAPVNVQLAAREFTSLTRAAGELKEHLATYPGLYDIADSFRAGKEEIQLSIRPQGEALGLTLADLARQVRQGFYGEEAQRIQRGRDEVKVMVRYPAAARRSLSTLENMRIRLPGGREVPFATVAAATWSHAPATIRRVDRKRSVNVTAEALRSEVNPNEVIRALKEGYLPQLVDHYPGLTFTFEGEQREQADTLASLLRGFVLAIILIYALLAIPFRSYLQPLVVMTAIPFGFIGAILGHMIMGFNLTILSLFGVVALTGVVVNDSLVMVDFINRKREGGVPLEHAVQEAGVARFRAIVLTSLTTFLGLTPMLLERSMQARFLIPMATSLAFGVLFATFVTMLMVPISYLILHDLMRAFGHSGALRPRRGGVGNEAAGSSAESAGGSVADGVSGRVAAAGEVR
jgi:multidrug efflux pump subunit AcrB